MSLNEHTHQLMFGQDNPILATQCPKLAEEYLLDWRERHKYGVSISLDYVSPLEDNGRRKKSSW